MSNHVMHTGLTIGATGDEPEITIGSTIRATGEITITTPARA